MKNKYKAKKKARKKPKVKFIVEREYVGDCTFDELFEPLLEMMIKDKYNELVGLKNG